MSGQQHLLDFEDNWRTAMGKWFPGERVVFRGQDLHHDLQDLSWMELFLYGITGRRFSENEMKVFTAIYTYTSFPEPRLWNNRVAALAGTARSTPSLAFGAANAMSEASIYGHKPNTRSIDFFLRTQEKLEAGEDLDECIRSEMKKYRTIFGYGRPLNRIDERNPAFLKLLKETGLDQGKHIKLALEIERRLLAGRWRLRLNITGLDAAVSADMGMSVRDHHVFMTMCFLAGMPPCYIDAREQREGCFFPIRCSRIQYEGVEERSWD
jgi:hypothetical protein